MAKKNESNEENVAFTTDQLAVIEKMLASRMSQSKKNDNDAVSVYNVRDPQKVETVNVQRIFGKFVIGFKNMQDDPLNPRPKYIVQEFDPIRRLHDQGYITLILSDGKETEEKKMLVSDYTNNRVKYVADVIRTEKETIIEDHGVLGSSNQYAIAVDEKGNPTVRQSIKAETKRVETTYYVELPGFDEPVKIIDNIWSVAA